MIFLEILMYILLATAALILILLFTPLGASVKYTGDTKKVYIHFGFIKLDTSLFSKKDKQKKIKKQSLKKHLKKQNKDSQVKSSDKDNNSGYTAQKAKKTLPQSAQSSIPSITQKTTPEKAAETDVKETENSHKKTLMHNTASQGASFIKTFTDSVKSAPPDEILQLLVKTLTDIKPPLAKYCKIKLSRLKITVATDDAAKTAILFGVCSMAYNSISDACGKFRVLTFKERHCGVSYDFSKTKTCADINIKLTLPLICIAVCLIKAYSNISTFPN